MITIKLEANTYQSDAEFWMIFLPRPRLEIKTKIAPNNDIPNLLNDNIKATFNLGKQSVEIPVHFVNINKTSGEISVTLVPAKEPVSILGDDSTPVQWVIFHLFNFKKFISKRRSSFKIVNDKKEVIKVIEHIEMFWQDWQVEIKSLPETEDTFKALKDKGGYGVTHIGCIRKKNGLSFLGKDAKEMLYALRYFFSFANGYWCPPVLCVGFNSNDEKIWEMWNSPKEPWHSSVLSWNDPHNSNQLADFFQGFMEKQSDESWKTAICEVIYWYLNSNLDSYSKDAGIILTQAAIERLSFEYAVQSKKLITSEGFKALRASDKFRLLFSSLDIPIELPSYLSTIQNLARQYNWLDAPHALTEIRNSLVHPEHKKIGKFGTTVIFETWNLGLWYLEMVILRVCEYHGTYSNRLTQKWVGQIEKVPWHDKKRSTS
jgi:hypothetical protein